MLAGCLAVKRGVAPRVAQPLAALRGNPIVIIQQHAYTVFISDISCVQVRGQIEKTSKKRRPKQKLKYIIVNEAYMKLILREQSNRNPQIKFVQP